ncbi:hypothetical protein QWJ07_11280 [Frankia sp. RB7]|nr:hypothetical protein [Frankia sp. RB7]
MPVSVEVAQTAQAFASGARYTSLMGGDLLFRIVVIVGGMVPVLLIAFLLSKM